MFKKILLVLILSGCSSSINEEYNISENKVISNIISSTVLVDTERQIENTEPEHRTATGNIIKYKNEFYVITCSHLFWPISKYIKDVNLLNEIYTVNITKHSWKGRDKLEEFLEVKKAKIVYINSDSNVDTTILKIEDTNFISDSHIPYFNTSRPIIGEKIYIVSNIKGSKLLNTFSYGYVENNSRGKFENEEDTADNNNYYKENDAIFQINAVVYFGSSGSGIYDLNGNYIGTLIKIEGDLKTVSFAVPFRNVYNWAKDKNIKVILENVK